MITNDIHQTPSTDPTERSTRRSRRRLAGAVVVAGALAVTLSACSSGFDRSEEKTADTGRDGKQAQLLADWVPDDARDVRVEQRTTGDERLMRFTLDGELPSTCTSLQTPGSPTDEELSATFPDDVLTRDTEPSQWARTSTLTASWWPEGKENEASTLCGRWWVSVDGDQVYAFAPDQTTIVEQIEKERAS